MGSEYNTKIASESYENDDQGAHHYICMDMRSYLELSIAKCKDMRSIVKS